MLKSPPKKTHKSWHFEELLLLKFTRWRIRKQKKKIGTSNRFFNFKWERNIGAYNKLKSRPFWHFGSKNIIFYCEFLDLPIVNLKNVVHIFNCSRNIQCLSFLGINHPTASFENLVFAEPLKFRMRIFDMAWMKERLRAAIMLSWNMFYDSSESGEL